MDRALTWFANAWIAFALLVNAVAIGAMFWFAPDFWSGWLKFTEIFSPYNVINYVAEVALLSPALIAIWWRDRRRSRALA